MTLVRVAALSFVSSLVLAVPMGVALALIAVGSTGVEHPLWTLAIWVSVSVVLHEVGHVLALAAGGRRPADVRIGTMGVSLVIPADVDPRTLAWSAAAGPLAALAGCLALALAVGPSADRAALVVLGVAHAVTLLVPVGDGKVLAGAVLRCRAAARVRG